MKSQTKFKQTEIGKIPEDWEIKRLIDTANKDSDIVGGPFGSNLKVEDYQDEGLPIIRLQNIERYNFIDRDIKYVSEEKYQELKYHSFKPGDIVLAKLGIPIGKTCLVPDYFKKGVVTADVVRIRPSEKIMDKIFLLYVLNYKSVRNQLGSKQSGTTRPRVNLSDVRHLFIPLPPLPEQKSIAKILSSLDEKIELNNKMNKTLEAIGQALFKKWFVDERKREWEISTIGKELKTILGGTPDRTKPEYWNGNINWINSGKVNEFRIIEPSEKITELGLRNSATKILPKGSVVLAITGATLGQFSKLEIDTCANQSVIGILENEKISSEYIYFWIKNEIGDIISHQTGGAQQHINKNNLDSYDLLIPDDKTLQDFNKIIQPIFKQISINCFQSQTLASLRDVLLLKLMSGEVRVK
jgi:type I restriction enzyme, S subunit